MSDRRLTPFSGRVALESLRGQVEAAAFTKGEAARLACPVADLLASPEGLRDRQLLFGADLVVIDRQGAHVFVQSVADGYCGWVAADCLAAPQLATHRVIAPATHVYREASIKRGEAMRLSLGARVAVLAQEGGFARTPEAFIPLQHLRALDDPPADPVTLAESLLGTPYLWGGNSRDGIDCSGLVQVAFHACNRACAADSDLQRAEFGAFLAPGTPLLRGDLFFWRGHVAIAVSPERLIHANGHTMSVAYEEIGACLARIEAAGEGTFYGIKRPA
ncbi:C40 family peptidase [Sedimentimonas flavescens]|uniref:C40 family peptidase n=1 Tax=Sedimentimonas flavescens TaxID=2851012 RepID=A0ABT3A1W0_9RHOB|nr:C40 family peptidase [Sedimentimonas flavescens]MCV2879983.1 C40 family peptidase [Sedimentimonas flavescens]